VLGRLFPRHAGLLVEIHQGRGTRTQKTGGERPLRSMADLGGLEEWNDLTMIQVVQSIEQLVEWLTQVLVEREHVPHKIAQGVQGNPDCWPPLVGWSRSKLICRKSKYLRKSF
jgi:hypothetical protein